jgi:hypothetical protein
VLLKVLSLLSFKMSSIFADLLSVYKTWPALTSYLTSVEGGALRIDDYSSPEQPYALIRYVKGKSNLTLPHVRAFRSVVWDTLENRPVSVTPFKSEDSEGLPTTETTEGFTLEHFVDGVMIGMWFDKYTNEWKYHTRSTIGANCRYYSQTKSFRTMFEIATQNLNWEQFDRTACYTWVLQDPENRIVVPVKQSRVYCVQKAKVVENGIVVLNLPLDAAMNPVVTLTNSCSTWDDVRSLIADWNMRFKHTVQGVHVKDANGKRWKLRTQEYNRVRALRGSNARLDFLWLSAWRSNTLPDYLALYPEERGASSATIAKWKQVTNDVFHIYVDVFKARSLPKSAIPPKYRPLVYGIHNKYITELKPAGKSVDWRAVLEYMNSRDIPQMLYIINWDLRQVQQQMGALLLPLEPPASTGTVVTSVVPEMKPLISENDSEYDDTPPGLDATGHIVH